LHKRIATGLLAVVLALCSFGSAFAGTTGGLRGRVIDRDTQHGIPGVRVTASSPSQTATATTDGTGTFVFISLIPDTYTLSIEPTGYDVATEAGVTVLADQVQQIALATAKITVTIGRVASRSNASLVKSGQTGDVYSVNAASAEKAQTIGGAGAVNQAYSAMASVPGVSLQMGQQGWNQAVFVRGGDYEDVAYELDGIPVQRASDGAPITTFSNLGQGELQVYTGGAPASADASGLSGYVNQVVKSGTNPGYTDVQFAAGGSALYNKFQIETSGATNNQLFSYYVGFLGVDQGYRYGDNFNGASDPLFFYPLVSQGAPTGNTALVYDGTPGNFIAAPGQSYSIASTTDREVIGNFHIGIPHKHDGGKDDIQLLYDNGRIFAPFYSSVNDLGGLGPVSNAIGVAYSGGTPTVPYWQDQYVYNGPVGAPITGTPQTTPFYFFSSPSHPFQGPLDPSIRDTNDNNFSIEKIQWQRNIDDHSYLRLFAYSFYNNWFINGPVSANLPVSGELEDYEVHGNTYGLNARYENQINAQNLITITGSFQTQKNKTISANTSGPVETALVDGNGNCIGPNGLYESCYAAQNVVTQYGSTPGSFTPYAAPAGSNAQWIVTENGYHAQLDQVQPYFSAASIGDLFRPTDKLQINAGIRYESFVYKLDSTDGPARAFWFNAWNHAYCYTPGAGITNRTIDPNTGQDVAPCPSGSIALVNTSPAASSYSAFQPRVGATYTVSPDTVVRAAFGRYAQQPGASYQQYNVVQQDLPSFLQNFLPFGYNSPYHQTEPSYANSYDLSLEHHFKGTDIAFKLTPFYRYTQNVLQSIPIGAQGIVDGINTGTGQSQGVEFELTKGDFSKNGLSFQLAYTFTHTITTFGDFLTGNNFIDNINQSVIQYNGFTQFCSTHPGDKRCPAAPTVAAAPCYTPAAGGQGAPDFSCAAGDVANPYWTAAPQALFDRTGAYTPYDILPSNPNDGEIGYVTPTVVTAIVNYRHNKFSFTPSATYTSGSFYGSPLSTPGYDPSTCTPMPGLTTPQTCTGTLAIPDTYSGVFDKQGAFQEPTRLTVNLQTAYEINHNVRVTLAASGLIDHCYQRGYAWDNPSTCVYAQLPSNYIGPTGNYVTPVSSAPVQVQYPYGSFYNNVQTGFSGQKMPLTFFANVEFRL
jgi:hypothetical protein